MLNKSIIFSPYFAANFTLPLIPNTQCRFYSHTQNTSAGHKVFNQACMHTFGGPQEKPRDPTYRMRNTLGKKKGLGMVLSTALSCRQSKPNLYDFRALVASWAIRGFESHPPLIVQTERGELWENDGFVLKALNSHTNAFISRLHILNKT